MDVRDLLDLYNVQFNLMQEEMKRGDLDDPNLPLEDLPAIFNNFPSEF